MCVLCGHQLRCYCGCFIREDGIEKHLKSCRWIRALEQAEYDELQNHLLLEAMV